MEINILLNGRQIASRGVDQTESAVMKFIGSQLPGLKDEDIPGTLLARSSDGAELVLELNRRGWVKHPDGTRSPSLYVTEGTDTLTPQLHPSEYRDAYLTCINPAGNNYKFYWLRPSNISGITQCVNATYGRLGSNPGERFGVKDLQTPYTAKMYWIRYYEKLSKGYTDETDIFLDDSKKPEKPQKHISDIPAENEASLKLYRMLVRFAKTVVNRVLADPQRITPAMVRKSGELYEKLDGYAAESEATVDGFNAILMGLLTVCPRSVSDVQMCLAGSVSDFEEILEREKSLINAMEAVVSDSCAGDDREASEERLWGASGVKVQYPTDDEKAQITKMIAPEMRNQIREIYMITPEVQKKRFDAYCRNHGITKVMPLFHGSGKQNWYSITVNSLLLPQHNNAKKTGQALGAGIYFGNHSKKSSHYTQDGESYILGIFDVAYGRPMMIHDSDHYCYQRHTQSELDSKGCNSLHYKRRGAAWADEIVVFNEDAICMKALVVMQR